MIKSFIMVKVGRFLDKANVKTPRFDQFSCSGPPPFFPFITIIIMIIGKANSKTPKNDRSLRGFPAQAPLLSPHQSWQSQTSFNNSLRRQFQLKLLYSQLKLLYGRWFI